MFYASPARRGLRRILAGAAVLPLLAGAAHAETVTSVLGVSATIEPACSVALSPVAFGSVAAGETAEASGSLTVTCTNGTQWTASADAGSGAGASLASRRMSNGAHQLSYILYAGTDRSRPWGDGSGATSTFGDTGTGDSQSFAIHGEILRNQHGLPAGTYSDIVAVTITY
jgi:spore coat protein U-like protein